MKSILGPNILLWCLPQKMLGDGLNYPVAMGLGKSKKKDYYHCCGLLSSRKKMRGSDSEDSSSGDSSDDEV